MAAAYLGPGGSEQAAAHVGRHGEADEGGAGKCSDGDVRGAHAQARLGELGGRDGAHARQPPGFAAQAVEAARAKR